MLSALSRIRPSLSLALATTPRFLYHRLYGQPRFLYLVVCVCAPFGMGGSVSSLVFACVCRQLFIALVGTSGARSSMRVPTPHGIHNRPTLLHDTLPDLTAIAVCQSILDHTEPSSACVPAIGVLQAQTARF